MTYHELLRFGEEILKTYQIEDAKVDAWLLFEYVTGIDRAHYFLYQNEECSPMFPEKYKMLLERRGEHIPLQHLTGVQEFMGFDFAVNSNVLIPRQETELLALETEKRLSPGASVLDLCTGSGCIIISLAKRNSIQAVAADISSDALEVARANAARLEADVLFVESDLFEQLHGSYDCIVSNPPYIKKKEILHLMPEVRDHEPILALDGHEDGLYFYRMIARRAAAFLKPEGWLLFEIGYDQGMDVGNLLHVNGYQKIEIKKDLAGLDRVVLGQRQ